MNKKSIIFFFFILLISSCKEKEPDIKKLISYRDSRPTIVAIKEIIQKNKFSEPKSYTASSSEEMFNGLEMQVFEDLVNNPDLEKSLNENSFYVKKENIEVLKEHIPFIIVYQSYNNPIENYIEYDNSSIGLENSNSIYYSDLFDSIEYVYDKEHEKLFAEKFTAFEKLKSIVVIYAKEISEPQIEGNHFIEGYIKMKIKAYSLPNKEEFLDTYAYVTNDSIVSEYSKSPNIDEDDLLSNLKDNIKPLASQIIELYHENNN